MRLPWQEPLAEKGRKSKQVAFLEIYFKCLEICFEFIKICFYCLEKCFHFLEIYFECLESYDIEYIQV